MILLTGMMASGKSTVAEALSHRLHPSVHLRGDIFRRMIVNGRVEIGSTANEAALDQLRLRYRAAHLVALEYWRAGFNVVYQDVVIGPMLREVVELFRGLPLHLFVLCPDPEAIAEREAGRWKKGYRNFTVDQLFGVFQTTPRLGMWIDSSKQSAQETTTWILQNLDNARI